MAFFLPAQPSFGNRLADVLGQVGENVGEAFARRAETKQANSIFDVLQDPSKTAIEKITAFQKLPERYQKHVSPALAAVLGPQAQLEAEEAQMGRLRGGAPGVQPSIQQMPQAQQLPQQAIQQAQPPEAAAQQPLPGQVGQYNPADITSYPDEILSQQAAFSGITGRAAQQEQQRRSGARQSISKRVEENRTLRDNLAKQNRDIQEGLRAARSGDVGGFDKNYIADLFGKAGEPFKSSNAALLQRASKNLIVDSINKISGRPNMWIDQQIGSATPGIGKSVAANESLFLAADAANEIEHRALDTQDDLLAEYARRGVEPPPNFNKIVEEMTREYGQKRQDRLAYDLRVVFEKSKGERFLKNLERVSSGTPLTLEKRDALLKKYNGDQQQVIKVAKKLGYTIPSMETLQSIELE